MTGNIRRIIILPDTSQNLYVLSSSGSIRELCLVCGVWRISSQFSFFPGPSLGGFHWKDGSLLRRPISFLNSSNGRHGWTQTFVSLPSCCYCSAVYACLLDLLVLIGWLDSLFQDCWNFLYEALGLQKGASDADIKKAYRTVGSLED